MFQFAKKIMESGLLPKHAGIKYMYTALGHKIHRIQITPRLIRDKKNQPSISGMGEFKTSLWHFIGSYDSTK